MPHMVACLPVACLPPPLAAVCAAPRIDDDSAVRCSTREHISPQPTGRRNHFLSGMGEGMRLTLRQRGPGSRSAGG